MGHVIEQAPTFMVHIAMLGWFPVSMAFFLLFGPVRGVILGITVGLFLLPNAVYEFSGIPDYDKMMATSMGVALWAVVFDFKRVSKFRPRWVDLPVFLMCLAPIPSSLRPELAELGLWNGLSNSFQVFGTWCVPWMLGRIYISNVAAQRYFAYVLVAAALAYAPFLLWEVKMSPQLHEMVYGIKLKSFKHASRSYGWRPNVFLEHGLMAALMISMATLTAYWMWFSRMRRDIWGIPIGVVFCILFVTTVATQSSNALLMLVVGIACLTLGANMGWRAPLLFLVLVTPVYISLRQVVGWDGGELVEAAQAVFGERRADSLAFRLENEQLLRDKAAEHTWTGWGDMGLVTGNTEFRKAAVTDSLWLILMGLWGLWGMGTAFAALLLPPWLFWKKCPPGLWRHPMVSATAVFAVVLVLFALDCLLNAFPNPLFLAAGGGIAHMLGTREGLSQLAAA